MKFKTSVKPGKAKPPALPAPKGHKVVTKKDVKEGAANQISTEVLQSHFGKQADTIVEMIEMNNSDGASSLIVKSLIQSLVGILPVAEHNVRATNATKGIYGFNTLVSSIRELLGDLQAFKDRSNLGQSIVDRSVRPSYQDIAVQIVTSLTIIQDAAKSRMEKEDYREFRTTVEEQKKALAQYITAQYQDVSDQVVKSLG